MPSDQTMPLDARWRRPSMCTIDGPVRSTASASCRDSSVPIEFMICLLACEATRGSRCAHHPEGEAVLLERGGPFKGEGRRMKGEGAQRLRTERRGVTCSGRLNG